VSLFDLGPEQAASEGRNHRRHRSMGVHVPFQCLRRRRGEGL